MTAVGFTPRLEIAHTDLVLHFRLLDYDRNCRLALADFSRPIDIPECRQASRDRFVEAFRAYLDGMFDALDIVTYDSAGP